RCDFLLLRRSQRRHAAFLCTIMVNERSSILSWLLSGHGDSARHFYLFCSPQGKRHHRHREGAGPIGEHGGKAVMASACHLSSIPAPWLTDKRGYYQAHAPATTFATPLQGPANRF